MPRLIIKYTDIEHVHSIRRAVSSWESHRGNYNSLKLEYQLNGKQIVVYEKGISDAIILACEEV